MKPKPPSKSVWWLQEHDNDDHSILVPFSTKAAALKAASAVAADPRPTVTRVEVWKKNDHLGAGRHRPGGASSAA